MKKNVRFITYSAIIAALYVAFTLSPGFNALSFQMVQFRVSESLMLLCMFTPAGVVGTTIGCFVSNVFSPFPNILDMVFGTLATFLAGMSTFLLRKSFRKNKWLAPLPTIIFNAAIVGSYLPILMTMGYSITAVLTCAGFVAIGEIVVCYALGVPLAILADKRKLLKV